MIGVIARLADRDVVSEFFELFKTPWEFYRQDQQYDVLLCAGDAQLDATANLLLFYAGRKTHFDVQQQIQTGRQGKQPCVLSSQAIRIPIYGDTITFSEKRNSLLTEEDSQECAAYLDASGDRMVARIGYDLFSEVRTLLTAGQPPANANIPALELHIGFLRDTIAGCGISFIEIPPVPGRFQFVVCLTHDVDHPSVRQHKFDHTIVGFLLRAVFGSLVDTVLGRMSIRDAAKNWVAAIKLPLVYMGLAKDFWRDFDDRYLGLEEGLPSTFFVIPRKNYPGKRVEGSASALRAAGYEAKDLADTISKLRAAGCEVGLHGIDAWLDSAAGCEELEVVRRLTGVSEIGVRMHWLYYNTESPATLEKAGAAYDSTIGYNETVGYRAGTTQVYKSLNARQLLELPLHVMDTALFYLSYLGLSPRTASARLCQMVDNVVQFGGCLTINWHDRSLAPERLWGKCYGDLIEELKSRDAWFATAGQAISWFRKRRSAAFITDPIEPGAVRLKVGVNYGDSLPRLRLRIHKAGKPTGRRAHGSGDYVDMAVDENIETSIPSEAEIKYLTTLPARQADCPE
jgi:peptidoglycan/xylan/chitin deacetylase (PgdA/CDA1 family)